MPGSRVSVLGDAEEFEAALRTNGVSNVLVTGRGQFRARVTQVFLDRCRLAAIAESLPRVAVAAVPAGMVLVSFAIDVGPSPIWGGIETRVGEMIALGPGQRLHARTVGLCHWGAILAPEQQLVDYGRAMTEARFIVPSVVRWRPPATAMRQLRHLHRAGIRMAEARAEAITDVQSAHGLEQQLLDALIECLSQRGEEEETQAARHHRGILARFEDLLVAEPPLLIADICVALALSESLLRACCKGHLGMGPSRYGRLRRLQQVHRALRSGDPTIVRVSEVAKQHGFHGLGHFAAYYRRSYGELPSTTLRRGSYPGVAELTLGRPRMKLS
jgi:AraC-like DNA-binding protein